MTHNDPPFPRGTDPLSAPYPGVAQEPTGDRGEPSTADVAKDQVGAVAGTASDAGKRVAGVAGEQAGQVASEASQQVRDLVQQTRGELTEQAATQQKRVAGGLRSLGEELHSMAQNSEQQGPATDLVKQAAERTSTVASWLEDREPRHVVDEVTRFARQRPGAFLAIAAGAGLLVGRLGRGLKAANDDDGNSGGNSSARGPGSAPNLGAGENSRQGYATTPPPQVPVYPPAPGYPQSAPGYPQPAPGFQQPPPGYRQPAPGYQPPPPGYPQGPGYPQAPGYPPAPGYRQAP
jgi:ElaB/YqjD/DUF883 family membrane-anchored ribosome-binding protein